MVLDGFREVAVLEISSGVAARMCGRWLASLGMSVARFPVPTEATSDGWTDRFLDADKAPLPRERLGPQLASSAIVVTDCGDQELQALGLVPGACRTGKLFARCTLFPDAGRAATSFTVMAATGHITLNGELGREPVGVWGPQAEHLTGISLATAVVAQLHRCSLEHLEGVVEVAASEVLASLDFSIVPRFVYHGERPARAPRNSGISPNFPIAFYEAADGYVWLNVSPQHQWEMLVTAIERLDLLDDQRFLTVVDRKQNFQALNAELAPWFRVRTRQETVQHLQTFRVPVAPLNLVGEAAGSPQLEHRQYWAEGSAWPRQWFKPLAPNDEVGPRC